MALKSIFINPFFVSLHLFGQTAGSFPVIPEKRIEKKPLFLSDQRPVKLNRTGKLYSGVLQSGGRKSNAGRLDRSLVNRSLVFSIQFHGNNPCSPHLKSSFLKRLARLYIDCGVMSRFSFRFFVFVRLFTTPLHDSFADYGILNRGDDRWLLFCLWMMNLLSGICFAWS